MFNITLTGKQGLGILLISITMLSFQNCNRVSFESTTNASLKAYSLSCYFNLRMLAEGEEVEAFLSSSVPYGEACDSEMRKCENGALSGSYQYGSCTPGEPKACLFNGVTIPHNGTVEANQNSSVPFDSQCVTETRKCDNGALSGSYQYAECEPGQPKSCLFNGQTIPHDGTVEANQNSSVPFDSQCVTETRKCENGMLTGSYQYASCEPDQPKSCLFNGVTIPHNGTVDANQNSSVPYNAECVTETRKCENGSLSGSFQYASCEPGKPKSCLFNGQTIAHGSTVEASQSSSVPSGSHCEKETRKCEDGVLSGSFEYASCEVDQPKSCLFNGQTIADGADVEASQSPSVPYDSHCVKEMRKCTNGSLSGSYEYASCQPGQPEACLFNGVTIPHNGTVEASQNLSVPFNSQCVKETRKCENGKLTGTYEHPTCKIKDPETCSFNGQTIAHNGTVEASQSETVPFNSQCVKETRKCENGKLSGTFEYASCKAKDPKTCSFNGQTIAHNGTVEASQSETVPFNSQCVKETRKCVNGVLDGTFEFSGCRAKDPKPCDFNGVSVPHGQSVKGFYNSNVPFGGQCSFAMRSCNNGSLSAPTAASHSTCDVQQPKSCLFNGRTIAHDGSVPYFKESSVRVGAACVSQNRKCLNGVLDGSFAHESCEVDQTDTASIPVQQTSSYKPFKLLIIVDNSTTMSQTQGKLAANINSLLAPLAGKDVDVKIITTSDSPTRGVTTTFVKADGVTTKTYNSPAGVWADSYSEWLNADYVSVTDTVLAGGQYGAPVYKILSTHSTSELSAKISEIAKYILDIRTNGSDNEVVFCPMYREMLGGQSSFFAQGDKAAVVVLTDEDDHSEKTNCDKGVEYKYSGSIVTHPAVVTNYPTQQIPGVDKYDFRLSGVRVNFTYKRMESPDGVPMTSNRTDGSLVLGRDIVTANDITNGTCVSKAQAYLRSQGTVTGQSFTTTVKFDLSNSVVSACYLETVNASNVIVRDNSPDYGKNLCDLTTVFAGGTTLDKSDSLMYVWSNGSIPNELPYSLGSYLAAWAGGCTRVNTPAYSYTPPSYTSPSYTSRDVTTTSRLLDNELSGYATVGDAVYAKAQQMFGSNFFMSFIVMDNPSKLAYGQTLGSRFISLAGKHQDQVKTYPIYADTYQPALDGVASFAVKVAVTSYTMNLPAGAYVVEVSLTHNGVTSVLDKSKYTIVGNQIQMKIDLAAGDSIGIKYGKPR